MKHTTMFALAALLIGCAAEPKDTSRTAAVVPAAQEHTSAALAFDPPITRADGQPDLARDHRGQAALVGFEEPATSVYSVQTYNSQSSFNSGFYDKTTFSDKTGVTHR